MLVKSLNYWSMPGGLAGHASLDDFLDTAADAGFQAVEMAIGPEGPLTLQSTEAECRSLRAHAEGLGLPILSTASTVSWTRSLGDADPDARAQAAEDLGQMLRISAWLGARTLLTIPGIVDSFFDPARPTLEYDEVEQRAEEGLRRLVPLAEDLGVRIAIENVWNKFLLSPTEMRAFVDRFASPFVGAYVDVANVLPYGHPDQWLRILGRRVFGIHFKDFRKAVGTEHGFVGLLEGDVDWPKVMAAVREIEYDGPLVAEVIPNYRFFGKVKVANGSRAMDAILAGEEDKSR